MAEAMAAKNSEIEALVNSLDAVKKQSALAEGNLASVQANLESIMRNRELTETRMMQSLALREELASVEKRTEEERAAHNATKMASMEREVELEHQALEASTALARIQGFLPAIALKIFLIVLPTILMTMSKIEGFTSLSSLDRRSAAKYHLFLLVNVFLGSIITGTALQQLHTFLNQSPTESSMFMAKSMRAERRFGQMCTGE